MVKEVRKTFYDKDFIPKNVEELYCSGWKNYLLFNIQKYSLKDVNHSPEDLLQDMMVQLATTHYIEKFDPEVAEFTVYLHTFVRNFMSRPYNKEHNTVNGGKIVNAVSIVSTDDAAIENPEVITNDVLPSKGGDFTDYMCLAQAIEKDLAKIQTSSKVEYNGKVIKRNPLTVYRMLVAGYDIKEIAEIFGTSKQFVYSLRKKITEIVSSYA